MIRRSRLALLAASALAVAASAAMAAEEIAYRYDARGRLIRVERTTASTNVVTNYTFDKADNRTVKSTTGSPNPPPP
jgi:YD repeat-containing protein